MNQDKINQVISVLCNSIQSERVFLEFAKIIHASTGGNTLSHGGGLNNGGTTANDNDNQHNTALD